VAANSGAALRPTRAVTRLPENSGESRTALFFLTILPQLREKNNMRYLAVLALLTFSLPALAETISGQVAGVSDGGTITVLDASKKQTRVRLAQIDVPDTHRRARLIQNRKVT
jgi:endonuclease YncB( thermonuclease family)